MDNGSWRGGVKVAYSASTQFLRCHSLESKLEHQFQDGNLENLGVQEMMAGREMSSIQIQLAECKQQLCVYMCCACHRMQSNNLFGKLKVGPSNISEASVCVDKTMSCRNLEPIF